MENIQLTIAINFISLKDAEEEHVMHLKSNNIEFMISCNVNNIVDELFKALLSRCQGNLETSMRGSHFIFDSFQSLYFQMSQNKF